MLRAQRSWIITVALASALVLAGCGGGGGGGGDGLSGSALLVSISATGTGVPLWQFVNGNPTPAPACPTSVPLNTVINFTFAGAVNPASLPASGVALGSININAVVGGVSTPAIGSFAVVDDPSLPAGNQRRVRFVPSLPNNPGDPAFSGLLGNATYTIFVPRGGGTGPVLVVDGGPLQVDATTCFITCNPVPNALACFTDISPGTPHVISTNPVTNDPSPGLTDPATFGQRVSIFFNEPLSPQNINTANVRLLLPSGGQVPGSVMFFQAGSAEAGPIGARIDYITTGPLLSNTAYEIVLGPDVRDFGGLSANLYSLTDPLRPLSGRRFFATVPQTFCDQPDIFETFDSQATRDTATGVAVWSSSGAVTSTFPLEIVGDGSFGPINFAASGIIDAGLPAMMGFSQGVWNVTDLTVMPGVSMRVVGTNGNLFRAHFRCLGTVNIAGTINASAGTSSLVALGNPEQGARPGNLNNGGTTSPSVVAGGYGGVGGGQGGRASQEDPPPMQVRTLAAESGFGPPIGGAPNTGPAGVNDFFGGGRGGVSGFRFPQGGVTGELGGMGGAGGSAFQSGTQGGPYGAMATGCLPMPSTVQTTSLPTGMPLVFATPVSIQSAGSGGGGGGDKLELAPFIVGNPTLQDDQGGGGGGGGGGIRISAVGAINITAGGISAVGGPGASGNTSFAGGGAGGSGGQIWLQSFADVTIAATANLSAAGGLGAQACTTFSGGNGGAGLIQIEDQNGMIPVMTFPGPLPGGANLVVTTFPFSTTVVGTATSTFFDTLYGAPDYTQALVNSMVGDAAGASVNVLFQGAFETISGNAPDLGTASAFVPAANIDMLDGRRYIRFRVDISYPSPPATTLANILPSVQDVRIRYRSPVGCTGL